MAQRQQFPGALKAKVAIEAIKGDKTINEIASIYQVHPNQVWSEDCLVVAGRFNPEVSLTIITTQLSPS